MSAGSRRVSGELVRAYDEGHLDAERELLAHGAHTHALMQQVSALAATGRSVLIRGETGTGKTMVANALHAQTPLPALPLQLINCAALSDALLADVLGALHGDNAPTPSDEPAPAITVLLDEIGELSPWGQAVLLRRLHHQQPARVRILAATHRDLDQMLAAGTFSRELVWRLNMARIALAPLRARRDEIVPLALHFIRLGLRHTGARFVSVDPDLYQTLEGYDWPGNVRELKNAILRAMAVRNDDMLEPTDLPDAVRAGSSDLRSIR